MYYLNQKCIRYLGNRIQSKVHRIGTYEINKISLSFFSDRIYIKNNEYDGLTLVYQKKKKRNSYLFKKAVLVSIFSLVTTAFLLSILLLIFFSIQDRFFWVIFFSLRKLEQFGIENDIWRLDRVQNLCEFKKNFCMIFELKTFQ